MPFLNPNEPLGLPRGSVRALITLAIVIGALLIFYATGGLPAELGTAFGLVVGYYFGSRKEGA